MIPHFLKSCQKLLEEITVAALLDYNDEVLILSKLHYLTDELTFSFHRSILSGENYLFPEEAETIEFCDKISGNLTDVILFVKNSPLLNASSVPDFVQSCLKELKGLDEFIHLYGDLIRWTQRELISFGDDQQNFQHFHISRIINFKSFEETLFNLETKRRKGENAQLYFLKLNLILAEFDFHLKCTDEYLNDLIELYRILDYIENNHKSYNVRTAIYPILKSKCSFLLKKAFARRHDLDGTFSFLSHSVERIKSIDVRTIKIDTEMI